MAAELLVSDSIIDAQFARAQDSLRELREHGTDVNVTALTNFGVKEHAPIDSYLRQLGANAGALAMRGYEERRCDSIKELIDSIREKDGLPGGTIVMAPLKGDDAEGAKLQEALCYLKPIHNLDGMTPEGRERHFPATPLSVDSLVNHGLQTFGIAGIWEVPPERIATVGNGRTVMQPYKELLDKRYGIKPGIEIGYRNSKEMLPRLHQMADVVITATGVAGLIKPEHLIRHEQTGRPMVIVDAGVGVYRNEDDPADPEIGNVYGDVHPQMYSYDGDQPLLITPAPVEIEARRQYFGAGVGPGTVAHLIGNGIAAARWAVDLSARASA